MSEIQTRQDNESAPLENNPGAILEAIKPPTQFEAVNLALNEGNLEEAYSAIKALETQVDTDRSALAEAYAVLGDPWSAARIFNRIGHLDRLAEQVFYRAFQPTLFGSLGMADDEIPMPPLSNYYRAFDTEAFEKMTHALNEANLSQPQRRLLEAVELEIENFHALTEPLNDLYHPSARDAMEETARILRKVSIYRLTQQKAGMERQALGDIIQDYYSRRGPALIEAEKKVKTVVGDAVKKAQLDRAKELSIPLIGLGLAALIVVLFFKFI